MTGPLPPGQVPYAVEAPPAGVGVSVVPAVPPRRRRTWLLVTVVVLAVVALPVALITVGVVGYGLYVKAPPKPQPPPNPLAAAQQNCDAFRSATTLADGGATLLIDGYGTKDSTGLPVARFQCILTALNVPAAVQGHMFGTRALDGRQEDGWLGFSASWSYHPDDGMDVIIRRV